MRHSARGDGVTVVGADVSAVDIPGTRVVTAGLDQDLRAFSLGQSDIFKVELPIGAFGPAGLMQRIAAGKVGLAQDIVAVAVYGQGFGSSEQQSRDGEN